jgi:hypothetical protein
MVRAVVGPSSGGFTQLPDASGRGRQLLAEPRLHGKVRWGADPTRAGPAYSRTHARPDSPHQIKQAG